MAKKLAITYYSDMMRGIRADIVVHPSGKEAVEFFMKHVNNYFSTPTIWNGEKPNTIPTGKTISVRIGFRGYHCRFLTDDEAELYRKYGGDCLFDFEHDTLAPPEQ